MGLSRTDQKFVPVDYSFSEIHFVKPDTGFANQGLFHGHVQGTFELANKEENREKNRYPNILPSKILLFFFT